MSGPEGSRVCIQNGGAFLGHLPLPKICESIGGGILPSARGILCIRGFGVIWQGVNLLSEIIGELLGICRDETSSARFVNELAKEKCRLRLKGGFRYICRLRISEAQSFWILAASSLLQYAPGLKEFNFVGGTTVSSSTS